MEITNADRERAVGSLKAAVGAGVISLDEFGERVQAAYAANSQDELELLLLTRDGLPLLVPKTPPGPERRRWSSALPLVVVAIVVVLGVTLVALRSRSRPLTKALSVAPSSPSAPTPPSAASRSLLVKVVHAGPFAEHDAANHCGSFGTAVSVGGNNCYLVVQFINIGSSSVGFIPADLRMVDYKGNAYSEAPVLPRCYDSTDINAPTTLGPHRSITVQLCYPVIVGALPAKLQGAFSLAGLSSPVLPTAVVGTWGGL